MKFKGVKVNLKLPIIGSLEGTWEPSQAEQNASWEMYVELITRISLNELKDGEGLLRESLTSLHTLFDTTRQILKSYGPEIAISTKGRISFGYLAVSILNTSLRPLLSKWHPLLLDYENTRKEFVSIIKHENAWENFGKLKSELEDARQILVEYANILGEVAGVPSLIIDRD